MKILLIGWMGKSVRHHGRGGGEGRGEGEGKEEERGKCPLPTGKVSSLLFNENA